MTCCGFGNLTRSPNGAASRVKMQEWRLKQTSKMGKTSWWNGAVQGWAGGVQGDARGAPEQALSVEGSRTRSRQGLNADFECWPSSEFVLYVLGTT